MNNKEKKDEFVIVRVSCILKRKLIQVSIFKKVSLSSYVRETLSKETDYYSWFYPEEGGVVIATTNG